MERSGGRRRDRPAPLATERLLLRRWTLAQADVEAAFAIFGDAEVTRFLSRRELDLESQRRGLARLIELSRGFPDGMGWFALSRLEDGAVIGSAVLKPLEDVGPEIEVGYHLARAHWGRGYATEAARGLLRHGFEALGLARIVAVVDPRNARSLAVVARLGMRPEGPVRCYGRDCLKFALEGGVGAP